MDGTKESHNLLRQNNLCFDKMLKALSISNDLEMNSNIAFSPVEWNINDFDYVYDVCKQYNVNTLRVQQLMPIGRSQINESIIPTDKQYLKLRRKLYQKNNDFLSGKSNIKVEWGDPIEHIINVAFTDNNNDNSFTEAVSIMANGVIKPSLYLPLDAGNIRKNSFSHYWDNGLDTIWKSSSVKEMAKNMVSVDDMNKTISNIKDW